MTKPIFKLSATAAFALCAAPAFAQTDYCGGQGAGGQWIGGSETASDIATAGAYQEQMALVLGGNSYVSLFSLSADAQVRVEAAGRGAGDPILDLYDSDGNIVVSDDDSGGSGSARAEVSLSAGTYCVATRSFDNAPMTAFVRVGLTDQEPLTQGVPDAPPEGDPAMPSGQSGGSCDSSTTAQTLVFGEAGTGSVADVPFWRFTLTEAMPITVTANNETADPYITVYDNTGSYLGENDDADGLNSRLDLSTALEPGDYCISMQALSGNTAPVTVMVTAFDPAAAAIAQIDRGEVIPPLDGSYPVTALGELSGRLRQDSAQMDKAQWFSFDVKTDGGLVLIEAVSADGNGDPYLKVFDDLGRVVAENDDNGTGLDSTVAVRVVPGTYLVALTDGYNGTAGVRLSFERFVSAGK